MMVPLILIAMILAMTLTLFGAVNFYLSRQYCRDWLGLPAGQLRSAKHVLDWLIKIFAIPGRDIQKKMVAAGIYHKGLAKAYLPAKFLLAILSALLLFILGGRLGLNDSSSKAVTALLVTIFWIIVPDIWLEKRRRKLAIKVSGNLPYLLDMMAVCVQTGMTIEAAIAYLAQELHDFDQDIAHWLGITAAKARISGTQHALNDLSEQLPSDEMKSFVHTLQQSLRYGNRLAATLTTQAADLRESSMLTLEEKVTRLSAQLSIPLILFIMLPLVILMTAPGIMRMIGNAPL